MAGTHRNRLVVEWLDEGGLSVMFVDTKREEHIASSTPPEHETIGFNLELSEQANEDPTLRMLASECAIYGLARQSGHIWGE